MGDIAIRKFEATDRQEVRRISCETAFLGQARGIFIEDNEILADALTVYFTDYEPDYCFVAVDNGRVIGYLTGTKDVRSMRRVFNRKIILPLVVKALCRGSLFKRSARQFLTHVMISFLKGEFCEPDFSGQYPAILHINIADGFRGRGIGSGLIGRYLDFLRGNGIRGVHLGTLSDAAKGFFIKSGFTVLFKGKRSYFRYRLSEDVPYYVLGKILSLPVRNNSAQGYGHIYSGG
jgi:GNAT superfamily N-acetyltransferase